MLWIFSFARSGSTLLLDFVADLLGYETIFEPFMEEPEKIKEQSEFKKVHDLFRGAPKVNLLDRYKIGSNYLGHIPRELFDSSQIKPYKELLKNYIGIIYRHYGPNTVVKCVRQQGNILFIQHLLKELNIDAKFIFLKRHPLEIAFSYWRNGGFHRRSTWNINQVFQYRRCMYHGESEKLDKLFQCVDNTFEKLLASIIADYFSFDKTAHFFQKNNIKFLSLNYEDFVTSSFDFSRQASALLDLSISEKKIEEVTNKYRLNPSKIRSSHSDPIFFYFAKRTRQKLAKWLEQYPIVPDKEKTGRFKIVHLKCFLRNVLPFIKVS